MLLSHEQEHFFKSHGYLEIQNFFSNSTCGELKNRIITLIDERQVTIPQTIFSAQTNEHARHKYFLDSGDKIHFFLEPNANQQIGISVLPFKVLY